MNTSFWTRLGQSIRNADRWLNETPERSLDEAYDAALKIRAIEDTHFGGQPILSQRSSAAASGSSGSSSSSGSFSSTNTDAYFRAELKKYLQFVDVRLAEFKASRAIVDTTNSAKSSLFKTRLNSYGFDNQERSAVILEKLKFIDSVVSRYRTPAASVSLVPVDPNQSQRAMVQSVQPVIPTANGQSARQTQIDHAMNDEADGILDKTGVLPRSILGTLGRIKRDLDPNSEQQVVQTFRSTKAKTLISIRFLLLLVIIPLLTQQLTKSLLVGPIVDQVRKAEKTEIFINFELQEEALQELRTFEERLRFDRLLGRAPALSEEQVDERLKEKAEELAEDFNRQSANAIKNVFADLFSVVAFMVVLLTNQREIAVLKAFIDETVYGLSDSAKAFIIILFTDIFVGFHSPHGWEVLLEGISRHLGLPANRDFIFLFIATFPVILDTIFKYWIFRYLNRISPSAVATYRNMNE